MTDRHDDCQPGLGLVTIGALRRAGRLHPTDPPLQATDRALACLDGNRHATVTDRRIEDDWRIATVCAPAAGMLLADDRIHIDVAHNGEIASASWLPDPSPWDDLPDATIIADEGRWKVWPRLWVERGAGSWVRTGWLHAIDAPKRHPCRVHAGTSDVVADYPDAGALAADGWRVVRSWVDRR